MLLLRRRPGMKSRHGPGASGWVLATVLCLALTAWAQTIRIPDFRQPAAPAVVKPGERCDECGRVLSIREIQAERRPAVPQAFQNTSVVGSSSPGDGTMVGAVVYLPLGNDPGDRPFVGGVGTPEMRERFRETTYEIAVRLDDGATRFIRRSDGTRFRVGDRVRATGVDGLELVVE